MPSIEQPDDHEQKCRNHRDHHGWTWPGQAHVQFTQPSLDRLMANAVETDLHHHHQHHGPQTDRTSDAELQE